MGRTSVVGRRDGDSTATKETIGWGNVELDEHGRGLRMVILIQPDRGQRAEEGHMLITLAPPLYAIEDNGRHETALMAVLGSMLGLSVARRPVNGAKFWSA